MRRWESADIVPGSEEDIIRRERQAGEDRERLRIEELEARVNTLERRLQGLIEVNGMWDGS